MLSRNTLSTHTVLHRLALSRQCLRRHAFYEGSNDAALCECFACQASIKKIFEFVHKGALARRLRALKSGGYFFKLHQDFFLSVGQVDGGFDDNVAVKISSRIALQRSCSFAAQAKFLPGLRALRNSHFRAPVQGGHFHLSAQGGFGEADGKFTMQIAPVPLEDVVRFDEDAQEQISRRCPFGAGLSLSRNAHHLSVVYARGNFDFQGAGGFDLSLAAAFDAGVFDDFSRSAAMRTCLLHLKNGLAHVNHAASLTMRAHVGGCSGFGSAAVTHVAFFMGRYGYFAFDSAIRFFECDPYVVAQIGALEALLS